MSKSLTYQEWVAKELGLSEYRFNQMAPVAQDELLRRYLEYRRREDEQNISNRAN